MLEMKNMRLHDGAKYSLPSFIAFPENTDTK